MKEQKKNHYHSTTLADDVVITEDNIVLLSRVIALSSLVHFQNYAYGVNKQIYEMHKNLQYDIAKRKELDPYTDAYDLVQEASYFLSHYLGRTLGEYCKTSRTGTRDCIRRSCFKYVFKYLRKERLEILNTDNDDDKIYELESDFDYFKEPTDYSKVNKQIDTLCKDKLEKQILTYMFNGVEIKNIAEFLNISLDKVYKRRRKFKDRYFAYCN